MASASENRRSNYSTFTPRDDLLRRSLQQTARLWNLQRQERSSQPFPFNILPIHVPRDGNCPSCRIGDVTRVFPLWTKYLAVIFFPLGLLAMYFKQERRCQFCNYVPLE
nr:brain protein I3-like isoform X2 [Procambarus clarkii]